MGNGISIFGDDKKRKLYKLFVVLFVLFVSSAGCTMFDERNVPAVSDGLAPNVHVPQPDDPAGVRVVTYNIRWGLGTDEVRSLDRIVTQLHRLDGDVAFLSEVDVNWRRSGNVDQPAYIAEATAYPYHYYGVSLQAWASGNARMSKYGNLLLSRHPIISARTERLPTPPGREPRTAVVAQLDVDGTPWIVIGAHLGLSSEERIEQTTRLRQLADEAVEKAMDQNARQGGGREAEGSNADPNDAPIPVVIMGDLNARPDAPEIATISDPAYGRLAFADTHQLAGTEPGYTFSYPKPYARIDYVFFAAPEGMTVSRSMPVLLPGSDHVPVIVDIVPADN